MRSATSSAADAAFAALADPTRRRVLELLRDREEMTAGELAAAFPEISRPAVSKHLRVLREARLLTADQAGREWRYRLDPGDSHAKRLSSMPGGLRATGADWLATFIPLFDESLDRLKIRVESTRRR